MTRASVSSTLDQSQQNQPQQKRPQRNPWRVLGRIILGLICAAALTGVWWLALMQPSHDRNWKPQLAVLPSGQIDGDILTLTNVRNIRYGEPGTPFEVSDDTYDTREYDLRSLETLWLVVEPFAEWEASAHTLLSFGFANGDYLALSVEARTEVGERFAALDGLLNQFELIYVFADERDVIERRTSYQQHDVYLYPIRVSPEVLRALLVNFVEEANAIVEQPRFYNTFTSTCTTNLIDTVNEVLPGTIPLHAARFLPGYADDLLYNLELIDAQGSFEEIKARHNITERAQQIPEGEDFSAWIRQF
ncbi:MAG: DUF4105 domain-containing protein [Deinococcota bacterium]